ncbi:MAG TPA: hypothetical protein VGH94_13060 [Acidimicrobiales bacterium]|jgi:hypothetical protein
MTYNGRVKVLAGSEHFIGTMTVTDTLDPEWIGEVISAPPAAAGFGDGPVVVELLEGPFEGHVSDATIVRRGDTLACSGSNAFFARR